MIGMVQKMIKIFKVIAYFGLVVFLYINFIGPEGFAEIFEIENPLQEGLDAVGILIPRYLLIWTIATGVLEVVDNLLDILQPIRQTVLSQYRDI